MKILYITEIFPDPRTGLGYWGGGERQVYEVARRVAKKGHQVTVLTCQFPGQGEYDTLEGIRVIREGLSRNQRTGGALLSISKVADYLARTIGTAARIDADIVHCNAYYPVIAGRAISTFRGVPMVSTFHDLPAPEAWESYTRSYAWSRLGYLATLASACLAKGPVLAVSENARAKLARVSVKGIQVIPNGVDLDLLDSAKTPRNEKQVLYVGRLVKYKGVGDLIAAFGEVLSKIDSARLVIVGDGPERKALETMAASLPPGSVVFTGTLPSHQQVAELYRESALFVLPSVLEGESIVLKEAMASRLPVIATRVKGSGVLGLVSDGENGYLVEPGRAHLLAESIIRLLRDNGIRDSMGRRGRSMAEGWSWDGVADRMLDVYQRAISGSSLQKMKNPGPVG